VGVIQLSNLDLGCQYCGVVHAFSPNDDPYKFLCGECEESLADFQCGDLVLRKTFGKIRFVDEQTVKKEKSSGSGDIFLVSDGNRTNLKIAHIIWKNSHVEVRAIHVTGPGVLNGLWAEKRGSRLRLGIDPLDHSKRTIELNQARLKGEEQPQRFLASQRELDHGASLNVISTLKNAGALEIGPKSKILGDEGQRRNFICATFEKNNQIVPVAAFVLTRVLPLLNGIQV